MGAVPAGHAGTHNGGTTLEDDQHWLVTESAKVVFARHARAIAILSGGGRRFLPPREGMRVFDREQRCFRLFADIWSGFDAPALPTGGSMIDVEARAFIADLVQSLRDCGLLR